MEEARENKISIRKSNIIMSDSSENEIEQNIKSELRDHKTEPEVGEGLKISTTVSSATGYKEIAEENEVVSDLYPDFVLNSVFDYRTDTLFENNFFSLPQGGNYECLTYCEAFIHPLNLAACSLVYTSIP